MRSRSCHGSLGSFVRGVVVILAVAFLLSTPTSRSGADAPYYSYTFNFWAQPVPAPQAYVPAKMIGSPQLGIDLQDPKDLFATDDCLYVLDSGSGSVIRLDTDFNVLDVIGSFERDGRTDKFNKPEGIFVTKDNHIYVADTENRRVVILDDEGRFIREITRPEPDVEGIIPEGFQFVPRKIAVDGTGRVYVIARDVYDGIMVYQSDGKFTGFIGAPRVTPSAADIFWRSIATREQRERSRLFLPTSYENLEVDSRGFIYGCIRTSSVSGSSPYIKRLSPSGEDVIRALGFVRPIGDPGRFGLMSVRFVDVLVRENGTYSVLDQTYGRIFTYDENGNLLYVFGGQGPQKGQFRVAVAMVSVGNQILVLDSSLKRITVFEPTEYAKLIHSAIATYKTGRYSESADIWRLVIDRNSNYDLAYSGIGRSLLMQGDFGEAMHYFRLGQDRANYSRAWSEYRRDLVYERFPTILTVSIVLIAAIYLAGRTRLLPRILDRLKSRRHQHHAPALQDLDPETGWWASTSRSLAFAKHLIFHPLDGFWSLKHEQKGSMPAAIIILSLVTGTYLLMCQYTGFIFNYRDLSNLNIYTEVFTILVPFLLWTAVNWALTTLMEGKGTVRDVFIATAYALVPLVIVNIPAIALSNFLTMQESGYYQMLSSLGILWSGFLIFSGTMVTHEYSAEKTVLATILIIAGMVITLFLGLLFFVLIDQVIAFVSGLVREMSFRI